MEGEKEKGLPLLINDDLKVPTTGVFLPSTSSKSLDAMFKSFLADLEKERGQIVAEAERAEEIRDKLKKEIDMMDVLRKRWDKVVSLNVGGKRFDVSHTTLTERFPFSMIGVMFSGRHEVVTDSSGCVFIDRDPETFRHVLNYMRLGEEAWARPQDPWMLDQLRAEFDFFQLPWPETKEERRARRVAEEGGFDGTTLLNVKQANLLRQWQGKTSQLWTLIYRATNDGFEAANFHAKCDQKGPTFVLIRSSTGYLFGGYNNSPWTSVGNYQTDTSTFLFTLTNPSNVPPIKLPASGNGNQTYNHPSYGPTFGGGHDIYVQNGSGRISTSVSVNFPNSFTDSTSKGANLFAGSTSFVVNEVEVFQIAKIQPLVFPTPISTTASPRRRGRGGLKRGFLG